MIRRKTRREREQRRKEKREEIRGEKREEAIEKLRVPFISTPERKRTRKEELEY